MKRFLQKLFDKVRIFYWSINCGMDDSIKRNRIFFGDDSIFYNFSFLKRG